MNSHTLGHKYDKVFSPLKTVFTVDKINSKEFLSSYIWSSLGYFPAQAWEIKKSTLEKVLIFSQEKFFLIFQEMELLCPKIKNFLTYFLKKVFLIFREMKFSSPKFNKVLIFSQKKFFLYFRKRNFLKNLFIFQEGIFQDVEFPS